MARESRAVQSRNGHRLQPNATSQICFRCVRCGRIEALPSDYEDRACQGGDGR
jgi:hypothetical protein